MPPPPGPARVDHCLRNGLIALQQARRDFGCALIALTEVLPGGLLSLPPHHHLAGKTDLPSALVFGRRRVRRWFTLRDSLTHDHNHGHGRRSATTSSRDAAWSEAERRARAALAHSADAFNWLDDAAQDLAGHLIVSVSSFADAPISDASPRDLAETAHAQAHQAGELVGGLFGCKHVYDDGVWFDQCVLGLLHLRVGNSVGITTDFVCTVCGDKFGACAHELGTEYQVIAGRSDSDRCTVCNDEQCNMHRVGQTVPVVADARMGSPRIREVSLTPRPRDPLTRITSRSLSGSSLRRSLGRLPTADDEVLDHQCMFPCLGFQDFNF